MKSTQSPSFRKPLGTLAAFFLCGAFPTFALAQPDPNPHCFITMGTILPAEGAQFQVPPAATTVNVDLSGNASVSVENYAHKVEGNLLYATNTAAAGAEPQWELREAAPPQNYIAFGGATVPMHSQVTLTLGGDTQYQVLYDVSGYPIRNGVEDDDPSGEGIESHTFSVKAPIAP